MNIIEIKTVTVFSMRILPGRHDNMQCCEEDMDMYHYRKMYSQVLLLTPMISVMACGCCVKFRMTMLVACMVDP